MARTFVQLAREEGSPSPASRALVCLDGEIPPNLDALDFELLGRWTERKKWAAMARELGVTTLTIRARIARPAFQTALARLQRNFFDQLSRGEFGAMALLKANAVGAVRRLLGLARSAQDERVRLNANLELIKLAGIQPPKPAAPDRPEQLLDQMSAEELDHFALTKEIPMRLADQVARMAATVLQARRTMTVDAEAEVEWEPVAGQAGVEAPEDPAERGEIDDEDGPAWERLPDETSLEGEEAEHG